MGYILIISACIIVGICYYCYFKGLEDSFKKIMKQDTFNWDNKTYKIVEVKKVKEKKWKRYMKKM